MAENGQENTKFTSIPGAIWWSCITLTTVGYGDIIPQLWIKIYNFVYRMLSESRKKTVAGKLIAIMCALSGILAFALPVPGIICRFQVLNTRHF